MYNDFKDFGLLFFWEACVLFGDDFDFASNPSSIVCHFQSANVSVSRIHVIVMSTLTVNLGCAGATASNVPLELSVSIVPATSGGKAMYGSLPSVTLTGSQQTISVKMTDDLSSASALDVVVLSLVNTLSNNAAITPYTCLFSDIKQGSGEYTLNIPWVDAVDYGFCWFAGTSFNMGIPADEHYDFTLRFPSNPIPSVDANASHMLVMGYFTNENSANSSFQLLSATNMQGLQEVSVTNTDGSKTNVWNLEVASCNDSGFDAWCKTTSHLYMFILGGSISVSIPALQLQSSSKFSDFGAFLAAQAPSYVIQVASYNTSLPLSCDFMYTGNDPDSKTFDTAMMYLLIFAAVCVVAVIVYSLVRGFHGSTLKPVEHVSHAHRHRV